MKLLFSVFIGIILSLNINAQDKNDAIVYIQGDKNVPIYLKMEGEMQERYSKNYFVLNRLASGPLNIEILFQQNQYPVQKYILNIPPSGQRSLVLKKIDDKNFSLYDLNYEIYIPNNNTVDQDIDYNKVQPILTAQNDTKTEQKKQIIEDEIPPFDAPLAVKQTNKKKNNSNKNETKSSNTDENSVKEEKTIVAVKKKDTVVEEPGRSFLDFEIDKSEKEVAKNKKSSNDKKEGTMSNSVSNNTSVCSEPISNDQLDAFARTLNAFDDEEKKLISLRKQKNNYCFSTDQIRMIALNFDSQSSRYEITRILKPKVTDPSNYEKLVDLFNTNYLKNRFKTEVVKK